MPSYKIRAIQEADNPALAQVVRAAMREFGADQREGSIYSDPVLDHMYGQYQGPRTAYWIAHQKGLLLGGAGIRQLDGTDEPVCELQRMFLAPEARRKGIGKALIRQCLQFAQAQKYQGCYLETMPSMLDAQALYHKFGFQKIEKAMGDTGHFACQVYMYKKFH